MDDDVKSEADQAVRVYVAAGFHDADEIAEIVSEEIFELEQVDEDWLADSIAGAMRAKAEDEATWPATTDCDGLAACFDTLDAQRIIALHSAGMTMSDGFSDAAQAWHDAGGERSGYRGFCFYHFQDVERAISAGELMIAFGSFVEGDDKATVGIGRTVCEAAVNVGLSPYWNGSPGTRIALKGISWQRRTQTP